MSYMNKPSNTRILVIDDEASMGEFMKIMLGKEGYKVTIETSAQHALQNFSDCQSNPQSRYDLMITDLMMPKLGGLELLKEIKILKGEVLIAIHSGK